MAPVAREKWFPGGAPTSQSATCGPGKNPGETGETKRDANTACEFHRCDNDGPDMTLPSQLDVAKSDQQTLLQDAQICVTLLRLSRVLWKAISPWSMAVRRLTGVTLYNSEDPSESWSGGSIGCLHLHKLNLPLLPW